MKALLEWVRKAFFPKVTSKKFTTDAKDWLHGLYKSAITVPITIIMQSVNAGQFVVDWKAIGTVALAGGALYIGRSLIASPKKEKDANDPI